MVIAVDCDDVIVESAARIIGYHNARYGSTITMENFYSADPVTEWKAKDWGEAVARVNDYLSSDEYIETAPNSDAVRVLRRLSADHDLHIISGRASVLQDATLRLLNAHYPDIFRSVELTDFISYGDGASTKRTKAEVCQAIGAELLIDDHLGHATGVADTGVPVLLFGEYPWSQATELPALITRVAGWSDVERYFYG